MSTTAVTENLPDIHRLTRYPIVPQAKEILRAMDIDSTELPRQAITDQARYRLLRALRYFAGEDAPSRVNPYREYGAGVSENVTDTVEFYSFVSAVTVASQESFARITLANSETHRMKTLLAKELPARVCELITEAFGLPITMNRGAEPAYLCTVEDYLRRGSHYEIFGRDALKLVNLPLSGGLIHLTPNILIDIFSGMCHTSMMQGMERIRKGRGHLFPFLADLSKELEPYIPRPTPQQRRGFNYVERLLGCKILDGRHRSIWLVLAPYLVNVAGKTQDEAISTIQSYVGETQFNQLIKTHVKRSAKIGLMPPSVKKLKAEHPDLYGIYEKAGVFAA